MVPSILHEILYGALPSPSRHPDTHHCRTNIDRHLKEVAAACIFLATKTEECGRKLRDVAKIYCSKVNNIAVLNVPDDSKVRSNSRARDARSPTNPQEVEQCQTGILLTEEALLEALCFDFLVISPHADLVDLFDTFQEDDPVCEYAWSIAHDS